MASKLIQSQSVSPAILPQHVLRPQQTSIQVQNPSGQNFISDSLSLFPSMQSTVQSQFSPQSHNSIPRQQYTSHSPRSMQSPSNPNSQYTLHSPQSMQSFSNSNQQFMYQSPGPAQSQQTGGHNISGLDVWGQSHFLGMNTMQMQQQRQQQIQQSYQPQQLGQNYYSSMQPQIMSRQVDSTESQTSSVYPQGGFPQTGGELYDTATWTLEPPPQRPQFSPPPQLSPPPQRSQISLPPQRSQFTPPPQRSQFIAPQIPSTGSTAATFRVRESFNNNSKNYRKYASISLYLNLVLKFVKIT